MDKTKISIRYETAPNNRLNMGREKEGKNIWSQEHHTLDGNAPSCTKFEPKDIVELQHEKTIQVASERRTSHKHGAFNVNKVTCSAFAPKQKHICKRRKETPDKYLGKDNGESPHERLAEMSTEESSDEYEENIAYKSTDRVDFSSAKKTIMSNVFNYLRRAVTNPLETIKNSKLTKKKGKTLTASKSISPEIFPGERKYISHINESSHEKNMSPTKLKILEDTKLVITHGKKKLEPDTLEKLEMQSETSIQSKEATLPLSSTRFIFAPITELDSALKSQSSPVKSAEEVLKHFRQSMQSKTKSLDNSDDVSKEHIKTFSKSEIPNLECYIKTTTESACRNLEDSKNSASKYANQDLKDFTKAEIKSATTQDSKIVKSKVLLAQVDNSTNVMKTTKNIPRQRIVYSERVEHRRGWALQQIKDRAILLKFRIMEGNCSKDIETKMRCIEEAEDLQEEIDALFDALDNSEKAINITNRFGSYSDSTKHNLLKSELRSKIGLKCSEAEPKRLSSLFYHLYKSSSSELNNEKVFERIHSIKLMAAYNEFVLPKKKLNLESEKCELYTKNVVYEFHSTLIQHRLKVKCKIPHTGKGSLEDYQNYVHNLKMAANENLNCLNTLIPQVASVIFPLMSYLSQSQKKFVQILTFLDEERPHVFLETSNKNKAFFDDFCQRHFKTL